MKVLRDHKFITACVIVAVIAAALVLWSTLRTTEQDIEQQARAIEDAVSERALQCYVIENAYPESLAYLEDNYGLTVNKEDFKIVYTPYAENLPPDVKVIWKGGAAGE